MGAQNETNKKNKSQSPKPSSPASQQMINNNNRSGGALIFTYGTLKRGFPNHKLMEELLRQGEAEFLGPHSTARSYPLVCGPYRIPFLLNLPGRGHRVCGELYAVSARALDRIDDLEGTSAGHYERLPIRVVAAAEGEEVVEAEAYYGHRSYGEAMWRRCGERGYGEYTPEVADGYVWRKDRPLGVSFLQRISLFLSNSDYHS